MSNSTQQALDSRNAEFWNELCGTGLAQSLGITEASTEGLQRFDQAYFDIYPYLMGYVTRFSLAGRKLLEIGLGYGTLGQRLAETGADYHGLDISPGPVKMMNHRLSFLGLPAQARVGSALDIPFAGESFDFVYSIGCLHHTGDLPKAIGEVFRVLKSGGTAVVMLYNRNSFRQLIQVPFAQARQAWKERGYKNLAEHVRAMYDADSKGNAAPHTDYVSPKDVRRLFGEYSKVSVEIRNFDSYYLPRLRLMLHREKMLNNIGRVMGLDLYITAQK